MQKKKTIIFVGIFWLNLLKYQRDQTWAILPNKEMQPTTMPTVTSTLQQREIWEIWNALNSQTDNNGNKIKTTYCDLFVGVS